MMMQGCTSTDFEFSYFYTHFKLSELETAYLQNSIQTYGKSDKKIKNRRNVSYPLGRCVTIWIDEDRLTIFAGPHV